jgi:hypothetical protein
MPDWAYARIGAGEVMPGLFVINNRDAPGDVIRELLLAIACTEQHEWVGLVVFLPL